jgi:glucose-6-phosphate isomerase
MLSKNINFKNFNINKINKKQNNKVLKILKELLKEENQILNSLKENYVNSYHKKLLLKFKNKTKIILIGMGGSILGARTIYNFLKPKIKKFLFVDSFQSYKNKNINDKNQLNLIISKSGNTLETISNSNILINKKQANIFITENKKSYLMDLAIKLKSEIVHHNNFIGGRYSVLSEVGMLPAELMGLSPNKFRRLNHLVKNKKFIDMLVLNVSNTLNLINKKKFNSIILNYDEKSSDLFYWYQQLIAESLGKKGSGILPIVSSMPKDNHSLMQYYLDGGKNNFFTFFFVKERSSKKIKKYGLLDSHYYLKDKDLNDISYTQFLATEKVFKIKKIPYRSFVINKRNEETLGELFIFFILETILLARAMRINPYNQPAVELIKTETKKILVRS